MPCEEEAFIHLFCLFSKTNRGQEYAATLVALCPLQLNFKLGGFTLPTFMVTSKPACCLPSPPAKSDYFDFYRLHKLQVEWEKKKKHTKLILLSPVWSSKKRSLDSLTCGLSIGH